MPFINQEDRKKFDAMWMVCPEFENKGELEYCIYKLMKKFMHTREYRYSTLHDTVYAAIHCGDEFRRNYLDKREDSAKQTNGDIK